jgi:hypothetical protein
MIQRSGGIVFAYRRELRLPLTGFLTKFPVSTAFVWDRVRLTRRPIAFWRALSERAVTGFEHLEEFGFGAASHGVHVLGFYHPGGVDHPEFYVEVDCLQITARCFIHQLHADGVLFGYVLGPIVSIHPDSLSRSLGEPV